MFPYADPQSRLDQHHQHAAELAREATAHRVAREAAAPPRRHFLRRSRRSEPVS